MLAEFEMLTPTTLPEALQYLAEGRVTPLAGGTNLVVDLRLGQHVPPVVMSIDRLAELQGIRQEDGYITLGANVTITEILYNPLLAVHAPGLVQAARLFANPLVRNRATVGGNLADASPAADTAPPLLALDAEVELTSQAGQRCLPLEDFFVHVRRTLRQPDELLTGVRFPIRSSLWTSAYYKIGLRKADAIAVVSAAVTVEKDPDGTCQQARIALGSVAPRPFRAHAAEEALQGQPLTPERIAEAGKLAAEAAAPISDIRGSAAYRSKMVAVLVGRLLRQAAGQPQA